MPTTFQSPISTRHNFDSEETADQTVQNSETEESTLLADSEDKSLYEDEAD